MNCNICGAELPPLAGNVCKPCIDKATGALRATARKRYYVGAPEQCDICMKPFGELMYDAAMMNGKWANMCQSCFNRHARGLGVGKGQRYSLQEDGRWLKTGG